MFQVKPKTSVDQEGMDLGIKKKKGKKNHRKGAVDGQGLGSGVKPMGLKKNEN